MKGNCEERTITGRELPAPHFRYAHRLLLLSSSLFALPLLSAQSDDIMDIRPMRHEGFWEANWWWLVPLIVVVVVKVALIFYYLLRKKPEKPLSAYQRAMKEIAEASTLKAFGDDKAFSIAVSNALRNYIEAVYRIRAPEQTTEEFLELAEKDKRISEEALKTLSEFLELCDLAKFARHAFGDEEREQLLLTAKAFVEQAQQQLREKRLNEGGAA